jgi:hypothetical protein
VAIKSLSVGAAREPLEIKENIRIHSLAWSPDGTFCAGRSSNPVEV